MSPSPSVAQQEQTEKEELRENKTQPGLKLAHCFVYNSYLWQ